MQNKPVNQNRDYNCNIIDDKYKNKNPLPIQHYRQTSNISHTVVGNQIVDHSDVLGAAPTSST